MRDLIPRFFSRPLSNRASARILLFVAALGVTLQCSLPASSDLFFAKLGGVLLGIGLGMGL